MTRTHIQYSGRVQGVGFRVTCRALAQGFGVTGWVRNDPAGTVILEAQGAADEVDAFLQAIRDRMSRNITHEDRQTMTEELDERGFRIER